MEIEVENETLKLVRNNLVHNLLWKEVEICDETISFEGEVLQLIVGRPVHDGEDIHETKVGKEYVLPVEMSQYQDGYLTLECIDQVFSKLCPSEVERIILAIANDDGTVVFYYIYKGLHKPRKNN
ncbi:hypothetical protein Kpol_1019p7 [Vanderwaltozyma polyspora DSM 70294]|uniref:tRNA-splicing endonuclease subunit Sen15 domain-containing protein n=1 Tax=Vanderwaltozyma polyspora (strain ATCC 22028 / DSM 70294 / BCRC 21397 / CBS 2163 / NBRC 10782 / NRRL Y-8283 / UCD 57-17) TaxID=436907 RepID=A7TPA0_VANPO|nr:uncharacterized protein Kpol_1019p7 [Vanderwaltozyma polyspora DSM 70294]EDO15887.1 hypothetical protein Kpol_1019p7 [Vanderwaltozyma polyspora DSM 70294]